MQASKDSPLKGSFKESAPKRLNPLSFSLAYSKSPMDLSVPIHVKF